MSIPSHMAGATAGSARRFATSPATGTAPKWNATTGAVAIVAASVIAIASAMPRTSAPARGFGGCRSSSVPAPVSTRPSGRPIVRIPATATKDSCHPGSAPARGFRARVAAAASSSAYQRDAGRDSVIAAMPAMPMTPARWSEGPAPASGT